MFDCASAPAFNSAWNSSNDIEVLKRSAKGDKRLLCRPISQIERDTSLLAGKAGYEPSTDPKHARWLAMLPIPPIPTPTCVTPAAQETTFKKAIRFFPA